MKITFDLETNRLEVTCHYCFQLRAAILKFDPFQLAQNSSPVRIIACP